MHLQSNHTSKAGFLILTKCILILDPYSKTNNSDEDTDVDIREWQRNPFRYPLFYSMEMKAKQDSPFIRIKRTEHQEHFKALNYKILKERYD